MEQSSYSLSEDCFGLVVVGPSFLRLIVTVHTNTPTGTPTEFTKALSQCSTTDISMIYVVNKV